MFIFSWIFCIFWQTEQWTWTIKLFFRYIYPCDLIYPGSSSNLLYHGAAFEQTQEFGPEWSLHSEPGHSAPSAFSPHMLREHGTVFIWSHRFCYQHWHAGVLSASVLGMSGALPGHHPSITFLKFRHLRYRVVISVLTGTSRLVCVVVCMFLLQSHLHLCCHHSEHRCLLLCVHSEDAETLRRVRGHS